MTRIDWVEYNRIYSLCRK